VSLSITFDNFETGPSSHYWTAECWQRLTNSNRVRHGSRFTF